MVYKTMYLGKINSPATTLTEDFEIGDDHIHVTDTAVFLTAPNICTIGEEEDAVTYAYTGITAGTPGTLTGVTVLEGTAKAWLADETICRAITAYDINTLINNVGFIKDHGNLDGLADDDHTQYIKHALATAAGDFLVASGSGAFVKKTLAEARSALISTDTKRNIALSAKDGYPTTTAGAVGPGKSELSSSKINLYAFALGNASDSNIEWMIMLPDNYDGGTITASVIWSILAAGSGTVCFTIAGRMWTDDDAADQAMGTPVSVTDTVITPGDIHVTPTSDPITIAGSPGGGRLAVIRVTRDVSEDTLEIDAYLFAVKLEYGINAWSA